MSKNRTGFLSFADQLYIGIWLRSKHSRLLYVNDGLAAIFEIEKSAFTEKYSYRFLDCLHPEDQARMLNLLNRHLYTRELTDSEWRLLTPGGETRWVRIKMQYLTVPDFSEEPVSAAFFYDVTADKMSLEQLRRDKVIARRLSELKANILSMMSHELRTPVAGILGFTDLIRQLTDDEKIREPLDMIEQSVRRLHRILDGIINYSSLDAGLSVHQPEFIDLRDVLEQKLTDLSKRIKEKGLEFSVHMADDTGLYADPEMIRFIVSELLENALKFTSAGAITLVLQRTACQLHIEVHDTGKTIPPELRSVVFDPFRQASEGLGRHYEGTGLGLSIISKQVEKAHGQLRYLDSGNEGNSFLISIPHPGRMPDNATRVKPPGSTPGLTVLVISQIPALRHLLEENLGECTVHTTGYPDKALEMARKTKYNLFLMDTLAFPDRKAEELSRQIRQLPGHNNSYQLAMTDETYQNMAPFVHDMGYDDYIHKPLQINTLKKIIGYLFGL